MGVPRRQPARAGHKAKRAPHHATCVATNIVIQPPVLKSVRCAIVDRTWENNIERQMSKRCDRKIRYLMRRDVGLDRSFTALTLQLAIPVNMMHIIVLLCINLVGFCSQPCLAL